MKTIARTPSPVATVLRAADILLRQIFAAPPANHGATEIAALTAATGHPSGA